MMMMTASALCRDSCKTIHIAVISSSQSRSVDDDGKIWNRGGGRSCVCKRGRRWFCVALSATCRPISCFFFFWQALTVHSSIWRSSFGCDREWKFFALSLLRGIFIVFLYVMIIFGEGCVSKCTCGRSRGMVGCHEGAIDTQKFSQIIPTLRA